ncbi:membrane protein insertase YidC [Nicoliella spurrieriana]|uniref:Membrane protein insertase YidC n=1 Tax=Nicoliella spurrieriana TaxID=2925830 RepID=A0A976RRW2_9LACO|nr:membrane protein insertase YidC [Nicoliella spurrieriana]UQS86692.1 membrane protein insertase YidC [Nicoliella spurrieriana]
MKKLKRLGALAMTGSLVLLLSGCVQTDKSGKPYGWYYDLFGKTGENVLNFIAKFVGGYGWALIVLTVLVRLVLLPLMVNQMRKSTTQQEKMNLLKPQMDEIRKHQKAAKTQEEQVAASQAMMSLYKQNGVSMTGGIGCLPMLIQLPVFAALYEAIRFSPELSKTIFFGIKLGDKNIALAILAFIAYIVQAFLSRMGLPETQQKQMQAMLFISPIFILIIAFQAPAGLGIYFFIGGIFACIQTFIINLYRPKIRREVEAAAKRNPPKKVDLAPLTNAENDDQASTTEKTPKKQTNRNRNRNAGKQNRK